MTSGGRFGTEGRTRLPTRPSRAPLKPGLSPVLSETQRELLADLLETGALLGQLKLVRGHSMGAGVGLGHLRGQCEQALPAQDSGLASPPMTSCPVLTGGAPPAAQHPVAGAECCVLAPQAPREWLEQGGTRVDLAGGMWPGAAGGRPPRVLGPTGPRPYVCTLCLPGTTVRAESGALLTCTLGSSPARHHPLPALRRLKAQFKYRASSLQSPGVNKCDHKGKHDNSSGFEGP